MPRVSTNVFSRISPAKPTIAFDTFWRFAAERQNVFFSRLEGNPRPWTSDTILATHKFTNAYRASDRVSQFLIKNVIGNRTSSADLLFRILLFKLFNKTETWALLENSLGEINWGSYRYEDYERVLGDAMANGVRIYSAAYIMAAGGTIFGVERKHQAHLRLLEVMLRDSLHERLSETKRMSDGFNMLKSYPLIGDFLAYQLITDINYSNITNYSELEFTMPGPGARDGIKKCFASLGGLQEHDIIRLMADRQQAEFQRLGIEFKDLWGRPLQLIDVQNLFCEVDKYSRVRHPELSGHSGRTRIKQVFRPLDDPIEYQYPEKWRLNVPKSSLSRSIRAPGVHQPNLF